MRKGYNLVVGSKGGVNCMDKLKFMRLWDLYGGLLTATQREMTDMYFNLDLTVSEIAEQKGISRQAVSDCLGQCKRELAAFERKLGHDRLIAQGDLENSFRLKDIRRWACEFASAHPEFSREVARLTEITDRDYGEEVKAAMLEEEF